MEKNQEASGIMDKRKWGVHEEHCCALHGCKYGDENCPVVKEQTKQDYTCEVCDYKGFREVEQITEYLMYRKKIQKAKETGESDITVSVEFFHRLLNPQLHW